MLYVFGLNSRVCSHIAGVHLSSDQVTYYLMMDDDLYNSFFTAFVYQTFSSNLQCMMLYSSWIWYVFLV